MGTAFWQILTAVIIGGASSGLTTAFKIKMDNERYEKNFNKYMEKKDKQTETNNKES